MKKTTINLESLSCPSCLQKIYSTLRNLDGIEKDSVHVMFNASRVKLNFDSNKIKIEDIERSIEKLGCPVIKSKIKDM